MFRLTWMMPAVRIKSKPSRFASKHLTLVRCHCSSGLSTRLKNAPGTMVRDQSVRRMLLLLTTHAKMTSRPTNEADDGGNLSPRRIATFYLFFHLVIGKEHENGDIRRLDRRTGNQIPI